MRRTFRLPALLALAAALGACSASTGAPGPVAEAGPRLPADAVRRYAAITDEPFPHDHSEPSAALLALASDTAGDREVWKWAGDIAATRVRWRAEQAAGVGDPFVWQIPRRFWDDSGTFLPQGVGIGMTQPLEIVPQQEQAVLPVRNPADLLGRTMLQPQAVVPQQQQGVLPVRNPTDLPVLGGRPWGPGCHRGGQGTYPSKRRRRAHKVRARARKRP